MNRRLYLGGIGWALGILATHATSWAAPQLKILLPLQRTAYQTNETIDLSVVRSDTAAPLSDGTLTLTVGGDDASRMSFTFPVVAAAVEQGEARRTEHLHLNGRLLRPGKYVVDVTADGATARQPIEVFAHLRRSTFKTLDWGSGAKGDELTVEGQDGMGFNLLYPTAQPFDRDAIIRGGSDFLWCCSMSGGHQMDLRTECDWSDPYVLQGGEARVVRRALEDRTMPNCLGVHFYDEPGLTWAKDPKTGVMSPFNLPSQDRSYRAAFGKEPPHYYDVKPDEARSVAEWDAMNRWREQIMPAAWKFAAFGVDRVRPDLLSVTQSVYGDTAYADGYYFNVVRPLPVISGHGGYSDWGPGYFNPVWTLEMGRIRDLNKPVWYLPEWSENLPPGHYRLSQYLSFITAIQGLGKPPGLHIQQPASSASSEAVVEANKLMMRLGTIFTTMPPTRPPVAMLYSLSQDLHAEVRDMQNATDLNKAAYTGGGHSRDKTFLAWMAGQRIHQRLFPIVEEDVLDGTLAAHHRALLIPGVDELPANVIAALGGFIKGGGTVLVSDDSKVQIPGATRLGAAMDTSFMDHVAELYAQKHQAELARADVTGHYSQAAALVAEALQHHLSELGIQPALDADSPWVLTARQAQGDIEYLFAVNATYDEQAGQRNSIKAAGATLTMNDDGRPVYDAVRGGACSAFKSRDGKLQAALRFGPGQMRAFARTARPIGGVRVTTPSLYCDYTVANNPSYVEFAASLLDDRQNVLAGSAPLRVRVVDPLGATRADLYRATDHGTLKLELPMAANDPSGTWTITVTELLSDAEGSAKFDYHAPVQCGALAGATHRAISFGDDRDHIFRLFRGHHDATIVKGTSAFDAAAADRVAAVLAPWDVRCRIVNAADVNKGRSITAEQAPTWAGLDAARAEPGEKNPPSLVGYDLRGPAILVGNPDDNPLIKFAADRAFLAYKPDARDFPGRGRGYIGWQRDAVAMGEESVTLVAYDQAGMDEAVGTMYEAVAGLDPLMPLAPPSTADVAPAQKSTEPATAASILWRCALPDRPAAMQWADGKLKVATADGSLSTIDPAGKVESADQGTLPPPHADTEVPDALRASLIPHRIVKTVAQQNGHVGIAYWGGTLQLFDGDHHLINQQLLTADITALAWLSDHTLAVGQSDGTVLAIEAK